MDIVLVCAVCSLLLAVFGFCVWFLVKDRNFWRNEYQARDREGRAREQQLFDQLLRVKGFKATSEPLGPQPHGGASRPTLTSDDLAIIQDRINERIEMGIMTPSEGMLLSTEAKNGTKTPGEIDRVLWQRQKKELNGSVADI